MPTSSQALPSAEPLSSNWEENTACSTVKSNQRRSLPPTSAPGPDCSLDRWIVGARRVSIKSASLSNNSPVKDFNNPW